MKTLVEIIEEIESGGNVNAMGDHGLAYGALQIHQGTLTDFNRWNGTNHTLEELRGDNGRLLSIEIFHQYMAHYATEKRLGRPVTDIDRARIWNGGPNGWNRSATRHYAWLYQRIFDRESAPPPKPVATFGGKKPAKKKAKKVIKKSNKKRL